MRHVWHFATRSASPLVKRPIFALVLADSRRLLAGTAPAMSTSTTHWTRRRVHPEENRAMSSMLNDTMNTAKSALETAKEGLESAKVTTEHAATTTRSVLLEGFRAVSGVISMLRSLD